MRPDLTLVCTHCRVRLPEVDGGCCPFCRKTLQLGKQARIAKVRRPWPVLPWKILGWLIGLLGLIAVIATPAMTVLMVVLAIVEHDEPVLVLSVGIMPVGVMSMAFGIGIVFGLFGGAAATIAVLLGALLRPSRGFDVYPLDVRVPKIRSRMLDALHAIEARARPVLTERKRQNATGWLILLFAIVVIPVSLFAGGGWEIACIAGFGGMLWGVGWSWWLTLLAEGPSWFVGLMDPTYAKKRRAACPDEHTRRDDFVEGTIVGPLTDPIAVPDSGDPAIGWHVEGHAKKHVIDDACIASFVMVTDDDERVVVIASKNVLIDLRPKDSGTVGAPFLLARGFGLLAPDRLALRRLRKGDRVRVSGTPTEIRDPDAGYRGGMLRAIEAGEQPLVVLLA